MRELSAKVAEFSDRFLNIRHSAYEPGYRLRFVLGRMENTLMSLAGLGNVSLERANEMQIEHIPQTPRDGVIPSSYAPSPDEYKNQVYRLGNVTLLESQINQAVNNLPNDLNSDWYGQKKAEYTNSGLLTPKLLDDQVCHRQQYGEPTVCGRRSNLSSSYGTKLRLRNAKVFCSIWPWRLGKSMANGLTRSKRPSR